MLEIKVVEDAAAAAELIKKCGKKEAENRGVMAAVDRGEVIAFSVFTLADNSMTIEHIVPETDIPLADGIIRSTIHVALSRGKTEVYYAETVGEKLLVTLDFIKDEQKKTLDTDKLFKSCCGCK